MQSILQKPWIEFIDVDAKINQVIGKGFGSSQPLSSPINYNRVVLFPDSDYFIVIDRVEGTESWIYSTIFRPTSLRITPTVDKNKDGKYSASEVGRVNGSLIIDSTPFDWQVLPFKTETVTGITTDTMKWTTVNPYGKPVELNFVSEPASDIKVTKLVGRIAGYDAESEVFSPVVRLTSPASQTMYRITALLSRYADEEAKTSEKVIVQGSGNALKIHASGFEDFVYTGSGNSTFDQFSTDAMLSSFARTEELLTTLLDGSYLKYQDTPWIDVSKKADFITVKKEGTVMDYRIQANPDFGVNRSMSPLILKDPERHFNRGAKGYYGHRVNAGINSGDSFDLVSFVKKVAKQITSFFNVKI